MMTIMRMRSAILTIAYYIHAVLAGLVIKGLARYCVLSKQEGKPGRGRLNIRVRRKFERFFKPGEK
jgi:hypothetical protein